MGIMKMVMITAAGGTTHAISQLVIVLAEMPISRGVDEEVRSLISSQISPVVLNNPISVKAAVDIVFNTSGGHCF